jgi:hypothetical protein
MITPDRIVSAELIARWRASNPGVESPLAWAMQTDGSTRQLDAASIKLRVDVRDPGERLLELGDAIPEDRAVFERRGSMLVALVHPRFA